MKRIACLVFTSLLLLAFLSAGMAQEPSNSQEKVVRETYRKLETYSVAAQVFRNDQTRGVYRSDKNLKFELSDVRSGDIVEILNKPYAELVTLPTGEVVS